MEEILRLMPSEIERAVRFQIGNRWKELQEIRFRLNRPIELNFHQKVEWVNETIFTLKDSLHLLSQLSEHSLYRLEDELREGYITIAGGHRVGLAGEVNTENGSVKQLKHITFFNIRIAREIIDLSTPYLPYIYEKNSFLNTLIIGAPQTGKTTMIRDLARNISNGDSERNPKKVGIVDERSEIAACLNGVPQHQIGMRTDVMDACPKVDGMMMMIRSMSPEVLIVDEIGKKEDIAALMEAINAGVTVICSVHGHSLEDIEKRPTLKVLFEHRVFHRFMILEKTNDHYFTVHIANEVGKLITSNMVGKR